MSSLPWLGLALLLASTAANLIAAISCWRFARSMPSLNSVSGVVAFKSLHRAVQPLRIMSWCLLLAAGVAFLGYEWRSADPSAPFLAIVGGGFALGVWVARSCAEQRVYRLPTIDEDIRRERDRVLRRN